ncbi:MAG: TonB-dependent receptor [Calditrichia bacterium]
MKFILIHLTGILVLLTSNLWAQQTGSIEGTVIDFNTEQPISGVLVRVEGTQLSARSDSEGKFKITEVKPGEYNFICLKSGYYSSISDPVKIEGGKICHLSLKMLRGDPDKYLYFSIGGITVTAERDLIPETHETVHKISSGEIEHMQATNLGDILDLIPGVVRKNQPGLQAPSKIGLRGVDGSASSTSSPDQAEAFGTRLIVDDIPISNNVNLNAGTGIALGDVKPTVGGGIDLRKLPADNIQEVEVIAGVPSVEYGDVTGGIIKVKTQSGVAPMRLKMKNNPDTKEFNLGGGFKLANHSSLNLNANYAYGLRDLRFYGDEVKRLNVSSAFDHNFFNKKLELNEKFTFTRWFDDYDVKGDSLVRKAYNHDVILTYGQTAEYKPSRNSSIYFRGFINYTQRENYRRQKEAIDLTYVTDRMTTGTQPATLLQRPYVWEITTTGKEYSMGTKLQMTYRLIHNKFVHNFLVGGEYIYEGNRGEGRQFDPLLPPNKQTGNRPRSFDDVPGFHNLSLYFEDRITANYLIPATLSLGLRGEMYNPQKLGSSKLIESQNGTFWNPRMGLRLKLHKNLQLRTSFGVSSKAPPLLYIYPPPFYQDVLEYNYTATDTLPLMTTYVTHLENRNLQGYQQKKLELSLDYKFHNIGISVTGFTQKTENAPTSVIMPLIEKKYLWRNYPSEEGKELIGQNYLYEIDYARVENLRWVEREGIEFTIRTHRIKPLNMIFRISGSFNYQRDGKKFSKSISNPKKVTEFTTAGDTIVHNLFPVYPYIGEWEKRMIFKYNFDYINRPLGIWLTFTIYHDFLNEKRLYDTDLPSRAAVGYFEDNQYYPISEARARELGLVSEFDKLDTERYRTPASFYFNLTVSKNIYQGMEVSLFVNNILNNRHFYYNRVNISVPANPEIFYGVEFSMMVDPIARSLGSRLFKKE